MDNKRLIEKICEASKLVKENKPLIEQITNYVTINDCANVTLAIGASPVMADSIDEAHQMTEISDCLVINFGGISETSLQTMINAGKVANEKNIPIVLDAVGVGATDFRNKSIKKLLENVHINVIKGNASEIMSLAGANIKTKGVDSSQESIEAYKYAIEISNKYRCVCAVTGKVDIITDGKQVAKIYNESDLLAYITGTGCMIGSLMGGFLGATKDPFISAVSGVLAMSVSGEMAYESYLKDDSMNKGICSYKENVINNIFKFDENIIRLRSKIEIEKIEYKYSMYLVTDEKACKGKDFYESVEASIKGGTKIVQLREKKMGTKEFFERASKLKEICHRYNIPFLVNDRLDIALAVDADGVHLGQSDMPILHAKKLLGHNKIIGISAKTMEEAREAQENGADYIGVGAIFSTDTKDDAKVISLEMIQKMTKELFIPVLAIGGIKYDNMDYLSEVDIQGVCVISDILGADDCEKRTKDILEKFKSFR